jgi:hypothetical protein
LQRLLKGADFKDISIATVHRETEAPHFETVLATGTK